MGFTDSATGLQAVEFWEKGADTDLAERCNYGSLIPRLPPAFITLGGAWVQVCNVLPVDNEGDVIDSPRQR